MKARFLVVLLLLAFSMAFSQALMIPEIFQGIEKLPEWIKPGALFYFSVEGGSRTYGKEGSALYGKGHMVFLVTDVYKNIPYGPSFVFFYYPHFSANPMGMMAFPMYLSKKALGEILKEREEYERQGIKIEGGSLGEGHWIKITMKSTTMAFFYSSDGKVVKLSILEKIQDGSSVTDAVLKGVKYIRLPGDVSAPAGIEEKRSYQIYTYDPYYTGMTVPAGRVTVEYLRRVGPFYGFKLTQEVQDVYIPLTQEVLGSKYFGPNYVNSAILSKEILINLPDIQLYWENSQEDGGYSSRISYQGQDILAYRFDENGILMEMESLMGMFIIRYSLEEF